MRATSTAITPAQSTVANRAAATNHRESLYLPVILIEPCLMYSECLKACSRRPPPWTNSPPKMSTQRWHNTIINAPAIDRGRLRMQTHPESGRFWLGNHELRYES